LELLDLLLKLLRDLFALFLASVVEDGRPPLLRGLTWHRRFLNGSLLLCRRS
jgi:hypothetical protein